MSHFLAHIAAHLITHALSQHRQPQRRCRTQKTDLFKLARAASPDAVLLLPARKPRAKRRAVRAYEY